MKTQSLSLVSLLTCLLLTGTVAADNVIAVGTTAAQPGTVANLDVTITRNSAGKVVPLSHGKTSDADYSADIVAWVRLASFAAVSLGGEYSNHRSKNGQLTNTFVSMGTGIK